MLKKVKELFQAKANHRSTELRLQRYAALDLAALDVIEEHCKHAEQLTRMKERKDSFYELELLRKRIIADYRTMVFQPLVAKARRRGMQAIHPGDSVRAARKELASASSSVRDFTQLDTLKRLYNSAGAMATYKRLNAKLRKQIKVAQRQTERRQRVHDATVADLNQKIAVAMRTRWCKRQTERWEPERFSSQDMKELALESKGPIKKFSPKGLYDRKGDPHLFLRHVRAVDDQSRSANLQRILKDIVTV